jgi:RNA polymerase sigma-70 factor (ECF subfamily)
VTWQDDLATFARERGPALVGYARLLTGDPASAEDLVQEAVVRAWSRLRTGGDVVWLEAYVRRTVLHLYVSQSRRERAWRERVRLLREPDARTPEHGAVDRVDIAVALTRLSPRERTCVVLRFYDDLTVPDIARRLDLSEGAVKRYLSDGTRRLGPLLGIAGDLDTEDLTTNGGRR